MRRPPAALACALLLIAVGGPASAAADPGDLDSQFATGGIYSGQSGAYNALTARDGQGRILVATNLPSGLRVTRLTSAGVPDPDFGGAGTVIVDGGPGETVAGAYDLGVLPDGKIVIVGTTDRTSPTDLPDPLIVRLEEDGDYDDTFSGDGRLKTSLIGGESVAQRSYFQSLLLSDDGSFVAGGAKFTTNGVQADPQPITSEGSVLARFTAAGVLDTTFGGGDGWVEYQRDTTGSRGFTSVARQSGGRLVAFDSYGDFEGNGRVVGYTALGVPDMMFGGGDSVVPLDFAVGPQAYVQGEDLVLDSQGRIVVAGARGGGGTPQRAVVARLLADGAPDNDFGSAGVVAPPALGRVGTVLVGCGDRVAALGVPVDGSFGTRIVRLLVGGGPDTAFGGADGTVDGRNGVEQLEGLGDGARMLVSGVTRSGGTAFVAAHTDVLCPGPPTVRFAAASASVPEGAGSVSLTVQRGGDTADAVSVQYATADGSATAPGDYAATSGTLNIAAGATSASFDVPMTNDAVGEGPESFTVVLSAPSGATLNAPTTSTVTIDDDDGGGGGGGGGSGGGGGGGSGGGGGPDGPDTRFISGPDGPTWIVQPTFGITASVVGATFVCSLDGTPFTPCRTPYVTTPLGSGDHEVRAAAVSAGVADPTPAVRRFRVNGPTQLAAECKIDPFTNFGAFGGATTPDTCRIDYGSPATCSSTEVCVRRTDQCPQGAICTLTTTASWKQRGIGFHTLVYANSRLEQASPPLSITGNYTQQCGTGEACSTRDVQRAVGPAPSMTASCLARALPIYREVKSKTPIYINGPADKRYPPGSVIVPQRPLPPSGSGADLVRALTCSARLEIEPAPPARLTSLGGTTLSTFAPAAGKVVISAGPSGARGSRVTAAQARPAFATITRTVRSAGPVVVKLKLGRTAARTLKRKRRLTVAMRTTFTPISGRAATTTQRITLRPAAKRLGPCPARARSQRQLIGCVPRGLKRP